MAEVIIQRITLEGGKEVEAALNSIGKTGEDAFKRIQDSASGVGQSTGLKNVAADAKVAGASVADAAAKTATLRTVMDTLGSTSKEAGREVKGMSRSAADAAAGMGRLNDASDQAGAALGATDIAAIRFGQTVRLIGRAARIPELSALGRAVSVLGRAFQVAAPALFLAFLGKLTSSAAKAADTVADLAAKNKVSLQDFQNFSSAFAGVGAGVDEAGKSFHSLDAVIKETATNTKRNEADFKRMGDEIKTAKEKSADLSDGFVKIEREGTHALRDIRQEQAAFSRETVNSVRDFELSLRKISEARSDISNAPSASEQRRRQLRDLDEQETKLRQKNNDDIAKRAQDAIKLQEKEADAIRKQQEETKKLNEQKAAEEKKIRDTTKALADARLEAERNATALEKLGIRALDSTGKLKKVPVIMADIADALKGIADADKRTEVENDLVAAGLDRKLLPSLRRGAAAFQELERRGKEIQPPFTDAQVQTADEFQIAMGQAGLALGALKNALGLAVAPAFTVFFERMRDLFIELRPAIAEFGALLNTALKPVLEGLATAIKFVVDAFGTLLSTLASLINSVFGSSVTPVQLFAVVLGSVVVALLGLPAAITLVIAAVGKLLDLINNSNFSPFTKNVLKALAIAGAAFLLLLPLIVTVVAGIVKAVVPVARVFGAGITTVTRFGSIIAGFGTIVARVFALAIPFVVRFVAVLGGVAGIVIRAAVAVVGFVASIASIPLIIAVVVAAAAGFFAVWAFQNWDKITQFASDTWEAIKQGAQDLWDATKQVFSDGVDAVAEFFSETIPNAAQQGWDFVIAGAKALWENITQVFEAGIQAVANFFTQTIPEAAQAAWDFISSGAETLWNGVTGIFQAGIDRVIGFFTRLRDFAVGVWNAIAGAAAGAANAQNAAGDGSTGGFARGGGPIHGAGTSTSDSIPAWLSTGEFVHNAKAVRFYGVEFMRAINSMRLPKDMFRGFNLGGLVERMQLNMPMRFASGGSVAPSGGSLHPVTIDLGGGQKITGLQGSANVVRALTRASINRQVASAGRKPSYFGRGK